MCVRNTTALLVFLVRMVVPQPQNGLDQEEADDNGTEYCVCLARPFVELLKVRSKTSYEGMRARTYIIHHHGELDA